MIGLLKTCQENHVGVLLLIAIAGSASYFIGDLVSIIIKACKRKP